MFANRSLPFLRRLTLGVLTPHTSIVPGLDSFSPTVDEGWTLTGTVTNRSLATMASDPSTYKLNRWFTFLAWLVLQ